MNQYRVPKRDVWAEAAIAGQGRQRIRLFLSEQPSSHTGFERPSDLLTGPLDYINVVDEKGEGMVLRRDAVVFVTVDATEEIFDDHPLGAPGDAEHVTRLDVELTFDGGESVTGTVGFVQPEARRRLGDWLNDAEAFVAVRDVEKVHVVNKTRIVIGRVRR